MAGRGQKTGATSRIVLYPVPAVGEVWRETVLGAVVGVAWERCGGDLPLLGVAGSAGETASGKTIEILAHLAKNDRPQSKFKKRPRI